MNNIVVENTKIEDMIFEVRGRQVIFASNVAKLYNTETKVINQVVKRNQIRFPEEFCFQLTKEEMMTLCSRSQFVTLNITNDKRGYNIKYLPYVFTEYGIIMLSGLLKSELASKMNIMIIRAFVAMRKYIGANLIEQRYINNLVIEHDTNIKLLQESFMKLEEKKKVNEIYFEGQIWDSYSKILDIFKSSKKELIIIDAYADKTTLDLIKKLDIQVTLIVKTKSLLSKIEIEKYQEQYNNLEVIYNDTFHDRYFILDKDTIYHCGTSLNHLGNKTFSINLLEDDVVKESLLNKIEKMII